MKNLFCVFDPFLPIFTQPHHVSIKTRSRTLRTNYYKITENNKNIGIIYTSLQRLGFQKEGSPIKFSPQVLA